jgi:Fe(3+) dicitrate transport protein
MTERLWLVGGVLLGPFLEPDSRTWWPALLLSLGLAVLVTGSLRGALGGWALWSHRSSVLDLKLLVARRLLGMLLPPASLGLGYALALALARGLDHTLGVPALPAPPGWALSAGYTLLLFVAWDLSRWLLHRLMHEVPLLWELHQVHHSAEVLTPLTFHRVHPLESVLYALRGALVSGALAGLVFWLWRGQVVELTVLGVNTLGLLLNAATGNLRHSHVWLRFPAPVERWLLSPAQHQLHHGLDPALQRCNHGTWLALWDRAAGTLRRAPEAPVALGLPPSERNHGHDLVSALLGPLGGVARRLGALLVLVSPVARAQEVSAEVPEEDEAPYSVTVVAPRGVPRVGGSAHAVSEEELERWGYDDIHRVLTKVPGVYVRGEDGFGLRPNIGMRGGSSDRSAKVALLQDGLPLAPAPYAAPAAYYFPLSSRLVGLEVFKGAASIRYGPQTIGGAINVLTRPVPTGPVASLDLAVGMRSTAELHGVAGTGDERRGVLLEAAHLSTRGFKELDVPAPTGFSRQDLSLKAAAGSSKTGLELALGYGRESSSETYLGLSASDFAQTPYRRYAASALDHMAWQHTEESLTWWLELDQGLTVRTAAYHRWLGRAWTKLNRFSGGPDLHDLLLLGGEGQSEVYLAILRGEEDSASSDQELMIGTNDRTFHNGGLQSTLLWSEQGRKLGSTLELGVRLHADDVVRLHTEDPYAMTDGALLATGGERLVTLDAHTRARALSVYLAEDARLGPLHVLPGVRFETIHTRLDEQSPRVQQVLLPGMGLYAEILPWLEVLTGVHRGFSPVPPGAPAEVRPETAYSGEAGLRLEQGQSRAEAIGFVSQYDNLTGQCTLSGGCTDSQLDQQFNGGEARVYGLETLAEQVWLLPHRLAVGGTLSWTYTRATFETGFVSEFPQWGPVTAGDPLPYLPAHQGTATLLCEHPRAGLALSATGRSAMRDSAGEEQPSVPGALQLDATLHVWPTDRIRAYASGTNLTDAVILESWRPFGARPAAPLQLSLGVEVGEPRTPRQAVLASRRGSSSW